MNEKTEQVLEKNVSYHYFVNDENSGIIAVAISKIDMNIFFGMAYCSPRDQFSRKRGRDISFGRLKKQRNNAGSITINGSHFYKNKKLDRHGISKHVLHNYRSRSRGWMRGYFYPYSVRKEKNV